MTDFDALRALVALQEHGNLTAAARALECPKSTLSRRLAALESALGHPLTRQEGGRLLLSDAGSCYAGYGERILTLAEEARHSVAAFSREMRGEVRVWVDQPLARGWATRTLNDFLARYPEVSLEVRVLPPGGLPTADGTDLWLACDDRGLPGLKRTPLGRWRRRLYTRAEEGPCRRLGAPSKLDACPWIGLVSEPAEIRLGHPSREDGYGHRPRARLRVDSLEMLADAIARGYGIGVLPSWLAECPRHGLRGHYARVLEDWEAEPVDLSCHLPRGARPRRIQVLVDHLHAHLPKRWALESGDSSLLSAPRRTSAR
ncbi:LysR family transcriptional regulator [Imhoffiella purpurea]|uniref:Transcriptional regulator, LysR family n=1 Tax=Imhoffiella purpurea TaxID=1249627 RepID=W9VUY9_9GAMM|nr:LysR family transcriptional regulator [Imhoffiella purpurea]EXJ14210.1 transcriptional regulator, LysR family [Imhoffiella purpurea]